MQWRMLLSWGQASQLLVGQVQRDYNCKWQWDVRIDCRYGLDSLRHVSIRQCETKIKRCSHKRTLEYQQSPEHGPVLRMTTPSPQLIFARLQMPVNNTRDHLEYQRDRGDFSVLRESMKQACCATPTHSSCLDRGTQIPSKLRHLNNEWSCLSVTTG